MMTGKRTVIVGIFIFIGLAFLIAGILAIGSSAVLVQLLAFAVLSKFLSDFIFLKTVTNYFDKSFFKYFFIGELYHLNYVIIVGLNALFRKTFAWKGRKITH